MKSSPAFAIRILLLLLALLGFAAAGSAQTATLVRDINLNPALAEGSPQDPVAFRGKILFTAHDQGTGRELWIYDETGAGPRLLADLCPGECSSEPLLLGTNGPFYFGIAEGEDGFRSFLWRTDGTRQGTLLLPHAGTGLSVPDPHSLSAELKSPVLFYRNTVYFVGCLNSEGCQIWRTDGSPEGTHLVVDTAPGELGSFPADLTLAGNRIFFSAGEELWVTDGTSAGSAMVRRFSERPRYPVALGSKLLFLAGEGSDEELWVSDGTAGGTRPLTNFAPAEPFQETYFLKTLAGKVYFVANDIIHGEELWASDGTPQGTVRVTEFGFHAPFTGGSFSFGLRSYALEKLEDRIVFWATDGLTGFKLWSTRGTTPSTSPICASCSFTSGENPQFVLKDGRILFTGDDGRHGLEPWTTDGTESGTRLLKDFCTGSCTGSYGFAETGGKVLFSTPTGLWITDGRPEGTRRFSAVLPDFPSNAVSNAATADNKVFFFIGSQPSSPRELWASDGTPEGTQQITLSAGGTDSSEISQIVHADGRTYFTVCEDAFQKRVWTSQGTPETTVATQAPAAASCFEEARLAAAGGKIFLVSDPDRDAEQLWKLEDDGRATKLSNFEELSPIGPLAAYKGQLYFSVVENGFAALWRSDGTSQGTVPAVQLPDFRFGVQFLKSAGNLLWFTGETNSFNNGIWRTDGTSAGTRQILAADDRFDPEFLAIGTQTFFLAAAADFSFDGLQVWRTDGTQAETVQITDFPTQNAPRALPAELTELKGELYFMATPPTGGRGLWRSDGKPGGEILLKTFIYREVSFEPRRSGLTTLGPWLIFAAEDEAHGVELWRSDGTAAGTTLLRDIFPGPGSSSPSGFVAAGGKLYFSANDGAHGFELWQTDGTPEGTRLVQDLAPEGASSYPSLLTLAGDRLYFAADDGLVGKELWTLPLSGPPCQPSDRVLCLNGGRFKIEASWRDFSGGSGPAYARALTTDTGYFFFFDDDNVEIVLKVLDGRGNNDHFWIYYGALSNVEYQLTITDTQTGLARRYFNPQTRFASVGDAEAFGPRGAYEVKSVAPPSPAPEISERLDLSKATGFCVPTATRLCLNQGRFAVEAAWEIPGRSGAGQAVGLTGDTGYFWFFGDENVELILKVLDGTLVNGKFWVYYGALSDVQYEITVTDTMTGQQKMYKNPRGRFASAGDADAF